MKITLVVIGSDFHRRSSLMSSRTTARTRPDFFLPVSKSYMGSTSILQAAAIDTQPVMREPAELLHHVKL